MFFTIGQSLRMLRFKKNLTQLEVARNIGISVNSLSRYENDERFPKKKVIEKLADFYGVEVNQILINAYTSEENGEGMN
ncbi:helix-turn-helix domain-containing protein [Fredinandcohnia sp. FSL W7-1320]|uniref:helix-turn-helix domain-containing protein n=1 Tax=Fredinandcohnia sp. FSL W7-1320 TaxID=2954540 RepID=UPI0030FD74DA